MKTKPPMVEMNLLQVARHIVGGRVVRHADRQLGVVLFELAILAPQSFNLGLQLFQFDFVRFVRLRQRIHRHVQHLRRVGKHYKHI